MSPARITGLSMLLITLRTSSSCSKRSDGFAFAFEVCCNHGRLSARNTRIRDFCKQHHAAAATHFAHDLFAEDEFRALPLPFFEF